MNYTNYFLKTIYRMDSMLLKLKVQILKGNGDAMAENTKTAPGKSAIFQGVIAQLLFHISENNFLNTAFQRVMISFNGKITHCT